MLDAYQEMQDVPYDRFQLPGIIAKGGLQVYLDGLPAKPYIGRIGSMKWLPAERSADDSFCRKWGGIEGRNPQVMVWHLRVPGTVLPPQLVLAGKPPLNPRAVPAARGPQAHCAGALEVKFDTEKLFAHVFKAATDAGMGVRVEAYGPTRANPDRNSEGGQVFLRNPQGGEGTGPWTQESSVDFYTFRLHIALSAPVRYWNAEWPGLVFFTVGGTLSWIVYRRAMRRDERIRRMNEETKERSLQDYNRELSLRQRREDVAFIRHTLAQPLTGISGCLEGLLIRLDDDNLPREVLERDLRDAFRFSEHARASLGEIREQLADQVERQRRNVAVAEVFQGVADLAGADSRFHGIGLSVKGAADLRVMASPAALEMVLLNLLRNSAEAIRDEGKGGGISLEAGAEAGMVKIRVEDDGPGLGWPGELFVPFRTSKDYGTGLGLVHCKSLVESFGGSIKGGNRMEGGAWFEIALPALPEDAGKAAGPAKPGTYALAVGGLAVALAEAKSNR